MSRLEAYTGQQGVFVTTTDHCQNFRSHCLDSRLLNLNQTLQTNVSTDSAFINCETFNDRPHDSSAYLNSPLSFKKSKICFNINLFMVVQYLNGCDEIERPTVLLLVK